MQHLLYGYRSSQASSREEALFDGASFEIGIFEGYVQLSALKKAVNATADSMDDSEEIVFFVEHNNKSEDNATP